MGTRRCSFVFIPTGTHVGGIEEKLSELRMRLAATDFELFEKKEALEDALKAAYEGQFEDIFFDLSATGEIDEPGVQKLSELFRMLHYMNGKPVNIIGVKPKHARQLHKLDVDWPVYYETSLKEVLLQHS